MKDDRSRIPDGIDTLRVGANAALIGVFLGAGTAAVVGGPRILYLLVVASISVAACVIIWRGPLALATCTSTPSRPGLEIRQRD
ncbi:hypothetical protein [Natrialba swarupiae]|uniref:Uncharacterized protein n=1 Tax=Natrialba swarupiae TaxID=2448032 RepID=A0A5D5AVJ1_9EURY|nr:hypothetical protein [Natrialba swarupiae]TYT63141.1 hypothetical protein FYC77_03445 [Natrialba swarupiae]